jgi:hypothetical protein
MMSTTMSTTAPAPLTNDPRGLVRPSREQLRVAKAMFAVAPEDVTSVVVPVAMPGTDVDGPARGRVEYPGGYWLADRGSRDGAYSFLAARDAARSAAERHLRACGQQGVAGWVSIRPNGTWALFDGAASVAA